MTSDTKTFAITRRGALRRVGLAASLPLLTFVLPAWAETPSGRLEMEEVELSLLLSAGWGHGSLFYEGTHAFKMKGLGVGGVGVSKLEAYGNVFRLTRLSDFPGAYGEARAGAVAGDAQLEGGMWMQNRKRCPATHQRITLSQGGRSGTQHQGISSSMRFCGQPFTRRVRRSVKYQGNRIWNFWPPIGVTCGQFDGP